MANAAEDRIQFFSMFQSLAVIGKALHDLRGIRARSASESL